MDQYTMMDILGKAFADGEIDALRPLMAADCDYASQYANKSFSGASEILSNMESVHKNIDETCAYTYKVIELESVLANGLTLADLDNQAGTHPCRYGLLLYQYGSDYPVAVVACMIDLYEKFRSIWLSRDTSKFNETFYGEELGPDSPDDLPSTVVPLTTHDRHVNEMRSSFAGQKWDKTVDTADGIYIWRKADEYAKQWLPEQGYSVLESQIFDDCIGYRCNRKGYIYTIFMYAYGQKKTSQLDGDFCSKLAKEPFAENSIILILYLNVDRYIAGAEIKYRVRNYCGSDTHSPEFWHLKEVSGSYLFEYYPRKEMMDQTWQFMYAFNREDTDIYDCIITDDNPSIEGDPKYSGAFMNSAFYGTLRTMHREYGDMKLGYVRYNDVVYSSVPYIEGLGFFSWSSFHATDRMHSMVRHPFDGGDRKVAEFIKTEQREPDDLFAYIPKLINAVPLAPVPTERFAVKLFFDNGECKKYVLPIPTESEHEEVLSYRGHVFTDNIWASVSVIPRHESRYKGYPECGPAIVFKNEFLIAGTRCYMESVPYSEPELTDEIVYADEKHQIRKIWKWNVNSLYEDGETGLLKVLISGQAFNWHGKSVFASIEGKRLTSLTFDIIDSFQEDLARVAINGHGYGFVDKDMKFVVPMKYDQADDFREGKAKVQLGDKWLCVDPNGCELEIGGRIRQDNYQEVGDYSEGMCRVSTLKLRFMDLAYHSDYDQIAGTWGFVNESGEEVIPPQYIYATDFENGIAIVAKGKWTIDPKWDNKYNQGRYWTEEELWGAIDKDGNEVIPFIFDEIKHFFDRSDMFMVHYGGWKDGHWGVVDCKGNWLAEPTFEGFSYETWKDRILFYAEDPDATGDGLPMGIYDLAQKKVLFEPQFLDVTFRDNGDMEVEVFDEELGRTIEKIIDPSGKERFKSIYSSIYTWHDLYEVVIRDKDGARHGLIDKEGNEILPCIYDVPWNGFYHEQQRICFVENGKQGMKDYDGNIIIPAIYHEIHGRKDPYLTVRVGEKDSYKEGLITYDGKTVIEANHSRIGWCSDHKHFFCCADGRCEMYVVEDCAAMP